MAAMDPSVTHLLKVDDDSYVHMTKLLGRLKALPREKLFLGYIEKAGTVPRSPLCIALLCRQLVASISDCMACMYAAAAHSTVLQYVVTISIASLHKIKLCHCQSAVYMVCACCNEADEAAASSHPSDYLLHPAGNFLRE